MGAVSKCIECERGNVTRRGPCWPEGDVDVLFSRVHEVKLGLPLHQPVLGRVAPDGPHSLADGRVDGGLGAGLDGVLEDELAVGLVLGHLGLDVELLHGMNDSLGTLDQVLKHGRPVLVELVFGVAL